MASLDFGSRSQRDEIMDTEPVSYVEFRDCLVVDVRWRMPFRLTLARLKPA